MQRVLVMGPPGSGKSTLARNLGARFGLPVFHLDQIYWRPGWIEAPAEVFGAEVERIAGLPAWVIDGTTPTRSHPGSVRLIRLSTSMCRHGCLCCASPGAS